MVGPMTIFEFMLLGVTGLFLLGYGVTVVEARIARRRPRLRDDVEATAVRDASADRDGSAADDAAVLNAHDDPSD